MKKWMGLLLPALLVMVSCGGGSDATEGEKQDEKIQLQGEVCTYSVNPEAVEVKWTAYKFTERAGVGGTFDSVSVAAEGSSENVDDIIKNAAIAIYTNSVNSSNADRDKKIANHFFGNLMGGEKITARVAELNPDGTAQVVLDLNGSKQMVEMNYAVDGVSLTMSGNVDLTAWEANPAVDSLNAVCYELHKGEDGTSKLWPDVDISVTAVLDKNCN